LLRALLAAFLLFGSPEGDVAISGRVTATEGETQRLIQADVRYAGPGIEKRKAPDASPAVVYLVGVPASAGGETKAVEIRQEGLEFRPRVVVVQVGTVVKFPNGDDLFHNVFSYSKAKRFDLGRYRKGESNEATFDKKGLVEVRCDSANSSMVFWEGGPGRGRGVEKSAAESWSELFTRGVAA
jgi:plastocyanin